MMGLLPTLVGSLGEVFGSVESRHYDFLAFQLGGAFTHAAGLFPFWEVFGNPVNNIVKFARNTTEGGHLTLSVPVEYWTNPKR